MSHLRELQSHTHASANRSILDIQRAKPSHIYVDVMTETDFSGTRRRHRPRQGNKFESQ